MICQGKRAGGEMNRALFVVMMILVTILVATWAVYLTNR